MWCLVSQRYSLFKKGTYFANISAKRIFQQNHFSLLIRGQVCKYSTVSTVQLHTPTRQHVVLVLVFTHRYYTNRAEYFPCLFFAIVIVSISADLFHHDDK